MKTLRHVTAIVTLLFCVNESSAVLQHFLLDFDTFTDTFADPADYVYGPGERMAIVDALNEKFADYPNVLFTLTDPASYIVGGLGGLTIYLAT